MLLSNMTNIYSDIYKEVFMPLVQGPLSAPVLQHLTKDDLSKLYFGEFRILDINGANCFLTRTGYAVAWFCFPLIYVASSFTIKGLNSYFAFDSLKDIMH